MIDAPAPVLTTGELSTSPSLLWIAQQPVCPAAASARQAYASARARPMAVPPGRNVPALRWCKKRARAAEPARIARSASAVDALRDSLRARCAHREAATARQVGAPSFPESVGSGTSHVRPLHAHLHARGARAALRARRAPERRAPLQHRAGPGRARGARARRGTERRALALGARAGVVGPGGRGGGPAADQR